MQKGRQDVEMWEVVNILVLWKVVYICIGKRNEIVEAVNDLVYLLVLLLITVTFDKAGVCLC